MRVATPDGYGQPGPSCVLARFRPPVVTARLPDNGGSGADPGSYAAEKETTVAGQVGRKWDTVVVARGIAAALTLVMVYYFWTSDAIRSGNPFLVPDLLLTLFALVSLLLPRRVAVPAMIFAFAWAAGVLTVSLFTYVVRGEFPVDHLFLILPSIAMAVLLGRITAGVVPPGDSVPAGSRPTASRV
ncbi:hypothetical protein ACFP2T_47140 [Plantactinospora solaniradicis]|uniref:Uncharacterized protein n=1 Tax=Plantactinospora solaniradicis TaxID=1723736 RepID=A0ABW1KPH6_9ACTN